MGTNFILLLGRVRSPHHLNSHIDCLAKLIAVQTFLNVLYSYYLPVLCFAK